MVALMSEFAESQTEVVDEKSQEIEHVDKL